MDLLDPAPSQICKIKSKTMTTKLTGNSTSGTLTKFLEFLQWSIGRLHLDSVSSKTSPPWDSFFGIRERRHKTGIISIFLLFWFSVSRVVVWVGVSLYFFRPPDWFEVPARSVIFMCDTSNFWSQMLDVTVVIFSFPVNSSPNSFKITQLFLHSFC